MRRLLRYFSKYCIKWSVFFLHLLYIITKTVHKARKSKLYTTFEAEIIILEIKFYKWAKRLGGERGSGQNYSGANGKVGETTRGRNDSGRKGKLAKRLRGERESVRNDPDSFFLWSEVVFMFAKYFNKLLEITKIRGTNTMPCNTFKINNLTDLDGCSILGKV